MRLLAIFVSCAVAATLVAAPGRAQAAVAQTTPPGWVPANGDFECPERTADPAYIPAGWSGTVPSPWHGVLIDKDPAHVPNVESALFAFGGMNCANSSTGIEKVQGNDSWVFQAPDIESTALPGKPFDAAMYQQVAVTPGTAYTLSGWMVSLCGGSGKPNDCPTGYYISKMLGLDPTGGTDPRAPTVEWVENRTPHIDPYGNKIGWQNLQVAAVARTGTMTVFVRVNSPFQHHGNHAFVDAVRMVAAPTAQFTSIPPVIYGPNPIVVSWNGNLGPEIPAVASNYGLYFDLQYRTPGTAWQDWLVNQNAGSATFTPPPTGSDTYYYLRVRARAEQPDGAHGFWPHLPGVWTAGPTVYVDLPMIVR